MSIYIIYTLVHVESCDHVMAAASQDVVDGSGPGALGGAGLRLGAARREGGGGSGGGGGGVPQATAGLHRGQPVHDAGQTLQAGGAGRLIGRNICRQKAGTFGKKTKKKNPKTFLSLNPGFEKPETARRPSPLLAYRKPLL